ncbi:MAG: amidohydrolase family protein [Solibacillus sp.]
MDYLLKNANVIDVKTGEYAIQDMIIVDGIIKEIKPNIDDAFFDGTILNFADKWILPGFIDMHVHIKEGFAHLFTASGVTTVRNMAGSVTELTEMINAPGCSATPRIYTADRLIDGPPGIWGESSPYNINVNTVELARDEVRRQVDLGADLIKVYGWLEREVMQEVVDEAKKHNKEVSCDLLHSFQVNAVDAAQMGIRYNEHCSGIIQAIYPNWSMKSEQFEWDKIDWEHPPEDEIREICTKLVNENVVICPTMIVFDQVNRLEQYWQVDNIVTEKMVQNKGLMQQWEFFLQHPESLKKTGIQKNWNQKIAKIYAELGGRVIAGTDSPAGIFNVPGMGLHRELELFVEAGFTNLAAIQAATIHAAEELGNDQIGIIKEGAIADLVVLNENPLKDINATREIFRIFKGGQQFEQEQLLALTPSAEEVMLKLEKFIAEFEETTHPL